MSGRRKELHRFPPGEFCDECRVRKWYAESGFRYCENGHRIEASLLSKDPLTKARDNHIDISHL